MTLSFGQVLALYRLLTYFGLLDLEGKAVMELERRRFLRFKHQMLEDLKESIEFFSHKNKWVREKTVVKKLLKQLGIKLDESELTKWEEPIDVAFRDARFQVKEVMQFEGEEVRRRHHELRILLRRAEGATSIEELLPLTPFREVGWDRIVTESVEVAKEHLGGYGPIERRKLDVVCYYNRKDHFEVPAPTPDFEELDCRSFSIVSNSYAIVLCADSNAPAFLREVVGTRHVGQFD